MTKKKKKIIASIVFLHPEFRDPNPGLLRTNSGPSKSAVQVPVRDVNVGRRGLSGFARERNGIDDLSLVLRVGARPTPTTRNASGRTRVFVFIFVRDNIFRTSQDPRVRKSRPARRRREGGGSFVCQPQTSVGIEPP